MWQIDPPVLLLYLYSMPQIGQAWMSNVRSKEDPNYTHVVLSTAQSCWWGHSPSFPSGLFTSARDRKFMFWKETSLGLQGRAVIGVIWHRRGEHCSSLHPCTQPSSCLLITSPQRRSGGGKNTLLPNTKGFISSSSSSLSSCASSPCPPSLLPSLQCLPVWKVTAKLVSQMFDYISWWTWYKRYEKVIWIGGPEGRAYILGIPGFD